jgi:hypothetical protein
MLMLLRVMRMDVGLLVLHNRNWCCYRTIAVAIAIAIAIAVAVAVAIAIAVATAAAV